MKANRLLKTGRTMQVPSDVVPHHPMESRGIKGARFHFTLLTAFSGLQKRPDSAETMHFKQCSNIVRSLLRRPLAHAVVKVGLLARLCAMEQSHCL